MRWYRDEASEVFSKEFHLPGDEDFVADFVVDALIVFASLAVAADFESVVELVAGELDLLAVVVVLDEADEVAGGEAGIVEDFEGALGGEVAGLFVERGGLFRAGRRRRRGGVLFAAPREDVGAVEAPDGHAGGCYSVGGAEVGAGLPAVGGAGGRVVEEEEEFVEEGDGPAVGVFGVLEPVEERNESRDFERRGLRWVKVGFGFGEGVGVGGNHKAAILRQVE